MTNEPTGLKEGEFIPLEQSPANQTVEVELDTHETTATDDPILESSPGWRWELFLAPWRNSPMPHGQEQKDRVLEELFEKYKSQFLAAGITRAVPISSPLRTAFDERARLEVRKVELAAILRAIDLADAAERRARRKQLEIRVEELDAVAKVARSSQEEDKQHYDYWSNLASNIDKIDALALARQIDDPDDAVREKRAAYEKASVEYAAAVDALTSGSPSATNREEAGAALEAARASLRAAITNTVLTALQAVMANTTAQSLLIASVDEERRSATAELRALETIDRDAGSLDEDALRRELEDVNNKLDALKGAIPQHADAELRREAAVKE